MNYLFYFDVYITGFSSWHYDKFTKLISLMFHLDDTLVREMNSVFGFCFCFCFCFYLERIVVETFFFFLFCSFGLSLYYTTYNNDSVVRNPPANAGDMGLIPGLGRYPGEGNGNPLHYLLKSSPSRARNTQGMSGEEDRQTDRHTEGCVEEVAFFNF